MKKIAMSVATATILFGGLTACGNANDSGDMRANYRQPGYQTQWDDSFNTPKYRGKGPMTEMMTPNTRSRMGTFGQKNRSRMDHYDNYRFQQNELRPKNRGMMNRGFTGNNGRRMVEDDGLLRNKDRTFTGQQRATHEKSSRIRTSNYLNKRNYGAKSNMANYHKDYDGRLASRIAKQANSVNGVDEARVIVHKDDVVIGIKADGRSNSINEEVENRVQKLVQEKNVHVVTDNDAVDRVRTMDDRLRTGTDFRDVGDTFADLLRDIGNTAARPFERAR